jgi:pyruvate kinase
MKGCESIVLPSLDATEKIVTEVIEGFKTKGVAHAGDAIVVVQGKNDVPGSTNTMRIQYA